MQDSMLPTVAYIGGPAEMAYLAQSEVIYDAILGRMPVAMPRAGFTMLDGRSAKLMDRYGLALSDFFQGESRCAERIAAELVPPRSTGVMRETAADRRRRGGRGCAPTWPRSTPRWRRRSTAARKRSAIRSARSNERPAARPCGATSAPRAMPHRFTA